MSAEPAPRVSDLPHLDDRFIFLSASFPSGVRGERFQPYDPAGVADAVVAVARGVLAAGGRLTFGGHPTITPLVLQVAAEDRAHRRVTVYQSEFFRDAVPPEAITLDRQGFGTIRWVDAPSGRSDSERTESLLRLRQVMMQETQPVGAFFVGGMEGIVDEWDLVNHYRPGILRFPIGRPGGATRDLLHRTAELGPLTDEFATSEHYPVLIHDALMMITRRIEGGH